MKTRTSLPAAIALVTTLVLPVCAWAENEIGFIEKFALAPDRSKVLGELVPGRDYAELITFVKDRPGHDRRYAIDASRIGRELAWTPAESFASGMRRTVQWYLDNSAWLAAVTSGEYHKWMSLNYATGNGRAK